MPRGRKPVIQPVVIETCPPPDDLDEVAVKAWHGVCADLAEEGTLRKTDRKLIELYARTYSRYTRVTKQLDREELGFESGNGRPYINPLCNQVNVLEDHLRRLLCDMLLTPKTRARKDATTGNIGGWSDFLGDASV